MFSEVHKAFNFLYLTVGTHWGHKFVIVFTTVLGNKKIKNTVLAKLTSNGCTVFKRFFTNPFSYKSEYWMKPKNPVQLFSFQKTRARICFSICIITPTSVLIYLKCIIILISERLHRSSILPLTKQHWPYDILYQNTVWDSIFQFKNIILNKNIIR